MAEAVLEFALEKLSSLIGKELGLFKGFDGDMKKLCSMFTTIKATLQDAEEKQFSNEAIKDWLQKLKEAAYEVDDIMDECAYEELQLEYQGVSGKVQCSCLSSFHPKNVIFRYKVAKRMKRISERLDEIAEERLKFHLTETAPERSGVIEWRQTSSIITERQVYGRKEDTKKIVNILTSDVDAFPSENLSVYPIVGLGGLGKTTLAQLIFNHEKVVNHFELRIWVCVSEDFSLNRMTKAIIEATSGLTCGNLNLEPLQRKLQDQLRGKRYLLVLDDVWDDKPDNWQKLERVLSCGAKGTSILVTTRLSKVATIMGTMPPHELSTLSEDDGWELFKHQAFGPKEEEQVELVVIGKEIVKKCGGVPLATKVLGGLLRFKRNENEWLYVKESNIWSLPHNENSIMSALRLSYLNLPIKLKQCFAYCAIFPKDKRIRKQYLTELWMANGFILSNEIIDAGDVGDNVWNELYWRSFFQDIETDEFGKVTSFKMHDLVHDLARSIGEGVCCITEGNHATTLVERVYHLSDLAKEAINPIQLHKIKSLRTYRGCYNTRKLYPNVLKCYSLRVLQFRQREQLSSSIGNLKHLRYLNLLGGSFITLPESLCKLWNLEILKLDHCYRLQKLPNNLIQLKALQLLSLNDCRKLSSLPPRIGKLSSLRILTTYIVGEEKGFLLEELGPLKLKGDLHMKHLGRVKSVMDAEKANMSSKQLNQLSLSWDINEESELQEFELQGKILEVLQPHTQQLQILSVDGYKGSHFPQWMSSSPCLKYLTYLQLWDCKNCLQLPTLGKLPSLKCLRISKMINIKYVYEECYDGEVVFLALESLFLWKLPNLIRLSREDGENMFPRLSRLTIDECPKLLAETLQHITALKKLELRDLPNLESLPVCFGNLPLLRDLTIYNCSKLRCLPMGLSLRSLNIERCREAEVLI
ncbi:putative disease resistance protein RGA3 isoform X2 [Cajanus cajan]|uniref:putative disease resistance protein RGA3 isoform X2 n=1 Tax=Cajanus cajan TaxID=3821 RepID=UPI00098D9D76|nr:putative disease resistance protein RGA3 isoform X2 [Cajanus cajan]XP_029127438.1 putative disease resistance protein RGA3 isoform X2 [Cajanus cajan]